MVPVLITGNSNSDLYNLYNNNVDCISQAKHQMLIKLFELIYTTCAMLVLERFSTDARYNLVCNFILNIFVI